ncbi:MAG: glycosyltransferase family 39 protein [Chloroflexi bacterium]|nr:glycosyltransferase family 39 protein [Chloroflexota bacterium]
MARRLPLFGIVWAYLALAALYAVNTPRWEVPDEPAHYNYVRTIAETGALPVLQLGDYDQAYLEAIKSQKFPPDMPVDGIRYESHQPPSYYLLATPFYIAGQPAHPDARLIGLRLYSVLWGAVLLALVYRLAAQLFPDDPWLPLIATSIAAFVPQHLAMVSGVNNDVLSEVILTAIALVLVRILGQRSNPRGWPWAGVLVGLGLLTKTTAYVSVGLVVAAAALRWWQNRADRLPLMQAVLPPARALLVAALIGSPWFVRGALTYGPGDWLGLGRHNAVVIGQPRTLELYGNYAAAAGDWLAIMFRSFWGQFGWMGVVLDARIYLALLACSLFALSGWAVALRSGEPQTADGRARMQFAQLALLAVWFAFTFTTTAAYSLEFFQAQGRYLFPALGAIAIGLAIGLRAWWRLFAHALARFRLPAGAVEWALTGALVVAFCVLDLVCLYRFLIPAFR